MSGVMDVNCERYEIKAGSIGHGRDGCIFRCTISAVPEDVLSGLDAAVRLGATIRLVFPEQPLLLERVELVRIDQACVRIAGHVVDGQTDSLFWYAEEKVERETRLELATSTLARLRSTN
jgi:hypothetical protein